MSLLSAKGNLQASFKLILTYSSNPKPASMAGVLPQDYVPLVCTYAWFPKPLQQS